MTVFDDAVNGYAELSKEFKVFFILEFILDSTGITTRANRPIWKSAAPSWRS